MCSRGICRPRTSSDSALSVEPYLHPRIMALDSDNEWLPCL